MGAVLWLIYMLIPFDGKTSRLRVTIFLGTATLFTIGLVLLLLTAADSLTRGGAPAHQQPSVS
jgi:hypothetical protein